MDTRDKLKLQKNRTFLVNNITELDAILDAMYEKKVIEEDDMQRVNHEITNASKVRKFLNIIESKPESYHQLIKYFSKDNQFIIDELDATEIDDEEIRKAEQLSADFIKQFLRKHFIEESGCNVLTALMKEDLRKVYMLNGRLFDVENWSTVDKLVKQVFPLTERKKGGHKRKEWQYKNLRRLCIEEEDSDTDCKDVVTQQNAGQSNSDKASVKPDIKVKDLTSWHLSILLEPEFKRQKIDEKYLEVFEKEKITGDVFENFEIQDMKCLFPDMPFGDVKRVHLMKGKMLSDEEAGIPLILPLTPDTGDNDDILCTQMDEMKTNFIPYRETFRKFDTVTEASNVYRQGGILVTSTIVPHNLIEPVHRCISWNEYKSYENIIEQSLTFVAACLNTSTNGTIHIGLRSQERDSVTIDRIVEGVHVKKSQFLIQFYEQLSKSFYKEQLEIIHNCVRPPQFVEVSNKEDPLKTFVIEIDVVPAYDLVQEDTFFMTEQKESGRKSGVSLYRFCKQTFAPQKLGMEDIHEFIKSKPRLAQLRQKQEKNIKPEKIDKDLRQKFLNSFCAGQDRLSDEIFPILLLSTLDSTLDETVIKESCEFITELDPNVIFDFDACSDDKGIFHYSENQHEKVVKVLTSDSFHKNGPQYRENVEGYGKLLDDIRTSSITPWVFCNGYEPLAEKPLSVLNWKKTRREGFKEAVRFFYEEIPENRAKIIFLLFSSNYDVLLEAAEEVMSKFPNEWIVFAENDKIISHWQKELLRRESVDSRQLEENCIIGIPWNLVNKMIQDVLGHQTIMKCELSTSTGARCHLKNKVRNELYDLDILSVNECENSDLIQDYKTLSQHRLKTEEAFFRGGIVIWWNFWFSDQVLKRSHHENIMKLVQKAVNGEHNDDDTKVNIVNLFHQPGAGGTTTAKHVLWCLRDTHRCAVIKQITDETCDQIEKFRNYEDLENPKPPIILIDNFDEEKVETLYAQLEDRARIISRRFADPQKVFCVLFLCTRRVNLPSKVNQSSVHLKHELTQIELEWFKKTHDRLQKQFDNDNGVDPRLLISFNILKENFDTNYIKRAVQEFVNEIKSENEQKLLQYLALLNSFDIEFQSLPVSAFDLMMDDSREYEMRGLVAYSWGSVWRDRQKGTNRKRWESRLSQSMQILLNRSTRTGLGCQLKALSIINSLFARTLLEFLLQKQEITISQMMLQFLKSSVFKVQNSSILQLKKIVKDVLIKRDVTESGSKDKFSPILLKILDGEGPDEAASVLEQYFNMTNDAMIAQQVSRLYISVHNWEKAEKFIRMATNSKPENSYLWDTYGQVFKSQLSETYAQHSKSAEPLDDSEAKKTIECAFKAMHYFKKCQSISEKEYHARRNNAGYFGEIRTMVTLLDVLIFWSPMTKKNLHSFLVGEYIPAAVEEIDKDTLKEMKNLQERSENVLRTIEEKYAQLKENRLNTMIGSRFEYNPQRDLMYIRENLDTYFGEDSDDVPSDLTEEDAAFFRRRRVRRLGGRSLGNILDLRSSANVDERLSSMLKLLLKNTESVYCNSYDMVTILSVTIVQGIIKQTPNVNYLTMLQWSKMLYDLVIKSNDERPYLEAYMYLVMFHWPTESRKQYQSNMCNAKVVQEAIRHWKDAFQKNHPCQKGDNNPFRKRETTYFFLGKENKFGDIVYHEQLGMKTTKGNIWEQSHVRDSLVRLCGTLVKDGREIQVQIETVQGNTVSLFLQNYVPVTFKYMFNKSVYFYLGFSWSGPKAYSISAEKNPPVVSSHKFPKSNTQTRQASSLRKEFASHEYFQQKLKEIDDQLRKIESLEKIPKKTSREVNEIRNKTRLLQEREELMQRRQEYVEY